MFQNIVEHYKISGCFYIKKKYAFSNALKIHNKTNEAIPSYLLICAL